MTWTATARAQLDAADAASRERELAVARAARTERDRIDAAWVPIRDGLDGLVADVAELHHPEMRYETSWATSAAYGRLICPGCDSTDDLDPPDWPCATIRLIRDRS